VHYHYSIDVVVPDTDVVKYSMMYSILQLRDGCCTPQLGA
jgi:hypothetical protein